MPLMGYKFITHSERCVQKFWWIFPKQRHKSNVIGLNYNSATTQIHCYIDVMLRCYSYIMAEKRKCFENFTEEEIKKKRKSTIPKATLKNNDKWDRAFRSYLQESGAENTQYWYYPDDELDKILCKFWFEARTQRSPLSEEEKRHAIANNDDPFPERYSIASLRNLRNGLSRCLSEHGKISI